MDVVIPLGTGSKWRDNELRYALRSIEKHLKGYRDIYIVGECLKWLSEAIHIPAKDTFGRKEYSIFSKIMKAVDDPRVSDDFVFWNDDIFLIKDLHVNDFKFWYEGTLWEKHEKSHGHYKAAIGNLVGYCNELSAPYMDIHTPIIYGKDKMKLLNNMDWTKEYVIKSLYVIHAFGQNEFEKMPDLKINKHLPYDEIQAKLAGRTFFSIGAYGVCPGMTRTLNELFPTKSKYES